VEELLFSVIKRAYVSDVRKIAVHTAQPLVPGLRRLEVEITIANLKKCKFRDSDQILAELIQARSKILLSVNHKLINYVWNNEELPDPKRSLLLYQFTKRAIKLTVVIIVGYHCYQLHTKCYQISFSQG
jgi:hypothetical protein